MNDFIYKAPSTTMIFGAHEKDTFVSMIKKESSKILLITGGNSFQKNGYYDELTDAFEQQEIEYIKMEGVTAPLLSKVQEGAELCRKENIGCVIGIGGGTCMDMAKAIAFAALQKEDILDFLQGKLPVEGRPHLVIGEIVTYPSSGSEMDGAAQIDEDGTNVHMGLSDIFPAFAWLNPQFMTSIPKESLAYGIMTSVAQISSSYVNLENADLAESISGAVIRCLLRNLQECMEHPEDEEAYKNLMLASSLNATGLFSIGKSFDLTLIPLEGMMQTYYGIGYAKAMTIMFPYWLKAVYRDHPVFVSYFENVFGICREGKSAEQFLNEGLNAIFTMYRRFGIAACYSELIDKKVDIDELRKLIREYGPMPSQYMEFDEKKIETILLEAIYGLND